MGTGLSVLQFTNMNMTRNIFVVGISIFLGLSVPQYFSEFTLRSYHGPVHTHGRWVNLKHSILNLLQQSNVFICLLAFSELILLVGVVGAVQQYSQYIFWFSGYYHNGCGIFSGPYPYEAWTNRFRTFNKDQRNVEFYSLPFGLHRLFPPT